MGLKELKDSFKGNMIDKADYIVRMHDYHKILFEYSEFIRTTDIQYIEICDGNVIATSREHGVRIICDPFDRRISPIETLNFDFYEKTDCDMILRLVENGQNVFDIGGNFGWYSLLIAKMKKVDVYTFEPVPRTYDYLVRNVALNKLENIRLFDFGFSNQEQDLDFYYYPQCSGNASIERLSDEATVETVTCRVKKLDDFVQEEGVSIDFIKCDVEGAELLVFQGGLDSIRTQKPIVFAELLRKWAAKFGYHPNQVVELFRECGYRCFIASGEKLKEIIRIDEGTVETNFFFLHEKKHSERISLLRLV